MMSGWSGFTDAELQKMKYENDLLSSTENPVKLSKVGQPQRKKVREKKVTMQKKQPSVQTPCTEITPVVQQPSRVSNNPNTSMESTVNKPSNLPCGENSDKSEPLNNISKSNTKDDAITNTSKESTEVAAKESTEVASKESTEVASKESTEVAVKKKEVKILSESEVRRLELTTLEQLQIQQKLIEDQNKKKQIMIKQTLQERFKQTQNESQKLKEINKQLNLIDQHFQTDVEELRSKIDEACLLFSHAQKRYVKAEKEYIDAKNDFFQKKEQKESLTEHLYAIIQDNEVKKAKRLEELMSKLCYNLTSTSSSPTEELSTAAMVTNNTTNPITTAPESSIAVTINEDEKDKS